MLNSSIQKHLNQLQIPALGMGCVNLSGLYGKPADEVGKIIDHAYREGLTFLDTADAYGNGGNEILIAEAIKKHHIPRDQLILSTKCGVVWDKGNDLNRLIDNSPSYIKSSCEASLKRLNTDYIDLYYLHRIANQGKEIEASMDALAELVQEGKIRHIGLSEANPDIIQRAHNVFPLSAVQSEYSLLTRDPEVNGVLSICEQLNIGFVAYSPLCRGLLSSDFTGHLEQTDFRSKFPRFNKKNLGENVKIVQQMEGLAKSLGYSVVQLSLGWVMSRGDYILPLPGTKSIKHLQENINASHIHLTEEHLKLMDEWFPVGVASGDRYSPAIARAFNLSTLNQ